MSFFARRSRNTPACPHCGESECVRIERVISGTKASRNFCCETCGWEWTAHDAPSFRAEKTVAVFKPPRH